MAKPILSTRDYAGGRNSGKSDRGSWYSTVDDFRFVIPQPDIVTSCLQDNGHGAVHRAKCERPTYFPGYQTTGWREKKLATVFYESKRDATFVPAT